MQKSENVKVVCNGVALQMNGKFSVIVVDWNANGVGIQLREQSDDINVSVVRRGDMKRQVSLRTSHANCIWELVNETLGHCQSTRRRASTGTVREKCVQRRSKGFMSFRFDTGWILLDIGKYAVVGRSIVEELNEIRRHGRLFCEKQRK